MQDKKHLSIIIPAYNEHDNLPCLFKRLDEILTEMELNCEIIVVNDGSLDGTGEVILAEINKNSRVKALFFSRNFGHQAALNAGFDYASGDVIGFMDADLQQPPEMIKKMYDKYLEGNEIVLCKRVSNKSSGFLQEKFSGLFYWLINKISDVQLEDGVADFAFISRKVCDVLREIPERDRFLRGLIQWVGFKRVFLEYEADKRCTGKSNYNWRKRMSLALSAITSFSSLPLCLSWWAGLLVSLMSVLFIIYVLIDYFFLSESIPSGWATLVIIICLLGGMQLIVLGIIGEYFSRLFYEIKGRPLYIVERAIGFNDKPIKRSNYGISVDKEWDVSIGINKL